MIRNPAQNRRAEDPPLFFFNTTTERSGRRPAGKLEGTRDSPSYSSVVPPSSPQPSSVEEPAGGRGVSGESSTGGAATRTTIGGGREGGRKGE